MKLLIDQALAQALANYLTTKPYGEVCDFIAGLTRLRPVETNTQTDPQDHESGQGG